MSNFEYNSVSELVGKHEDREEANTFKWRGLELVVSPEVFDPGLGTSSLFLAEHIADLPLRGSRVLDAGCGMGIITIAAAKSGASNIIAYDSNPSAVQDAQENCRRAGIEHRVEILETDEFPASKGPYDHIFSNPPLVNEPVDSEDWQRAFYDPDWQFVRSVLEGGSQSLARSGSIHLVAGFGLTKNIVTDIWSRVGGNRVDIVKSNSNDYPSLLIIRCY